MGIVAANCSLAGAQQRGENTDESKVPEYTLPDPLRMQSGAAVQDVATWTRSRRPEIVRLFEQHVYGVNLPTVAAIQFESAPADERALGGRAIRKEITIYLLGRREGPAMHLLLYLPRAASGPSPLFLGLNFQGNHCVAHDPGIRLSTAWMRDEKNCGIENNRATEASRGCQASRWQVEKILDRGYGLATVYYGDLEPDHPEGWRTGIRAALSPPGEATPPAADRCGAIGAWAWGLSRAVDYLVQDQAVDSKRIAVIGHSRLGKTALWAGALDLRMALIISNNSGEGGAAIYRRRFGERVVHLVNSFPHWFSLKFRDYAERESDLPVDAHELVALIAPRPVYIASATQDLWADPRGEFLAARHAEPVYALFGLTGVGVSEMPPADRPVGDYVGYHLRTGEHDVTEYDWDQYLTFADRHFGRK